MGGTGIGGKGAPKPPDFASAAERQAAAETIAARLADITDEDL